MQIKDHITLQKADAVKLPTLFPAETDKNLIHEERLSIPMERIGERFASLRIVDPQVERAMLESMRK